MPITVRQALPGLLGRLAVQAGQARGQQIRAAQDIQFTSMAMAAQDRAAARGLAARQQDRAFALQQAAASRMARERPAKPGTLDQRRGLHRMVSEAEAAGIYEPAQIKQAQIFAKVGDAEAVRSILGKLPQAAASTARQRELARQLTAVTEIGRGEVSELQKQLDAVNNRLGKRFTPGTQRLLRERPEYMKTVSPDIQESLALQQQLENQISAISDRTAKMRRMLQLGMTVPEQMAFQTKQETRLIREEAAEQKRLAEQVREAGKLTDREELAIDVVRDREQDQRTTLSREITRLSKDLAPFADENEDDHAKRIEPIQAQIRQLNLERIKSYAREKNQIEEFLRKDKKAVTQIVTDAVGQRWRFTGRYRNGRPLYEEID